ncbi:retrovirus-related Pol polyprotein from transposon 412 [Trichonephila clavipes]|uniref:Retrovirus-related Pol polyprotein from transposon 412 n=1 Tax=Trichonephila clavipes TaxID=2585209 RepID=A0A8X6RW14_TRICX|nr:retrovirus-related Pol polyprotein from transposon 412 [Trichonephila clavipes]
MRGHGSLEVKVSDRGWRVMSSSRVPLKTHHVGERCTLNLLRAQTPSRWCGVVVKPHDQFVPKSFRKLIFDQLCNISHPQTATTTKLICARYAWPNMKREIRECVECSEPCQRSKVERHTKAPLGLSDIQFREIHINILDPLPPSDGHICEESRPRLKMN